MSDNTLLIAGVTTVFVGLCLAMLLLIRPATKMGGVARSLMVIDQIHVNPLLPISEQSASERLVRPFVRRFGRLGRRLTPIGTPARLQRRLDLAGNPGLWSVERMLAAKAGGLALGAAIGLLMLTSGRVLIGLAWLVGAGV